MSMIAVVSHGSIRESRDTGYAWICSYRERPVYLQEVGGPARSQSERTHLCSSLYNKSSFVISCFQTDRGKKGEMKKSLLAVVMPLLTGAEG